MICDTQSLFPEFSREPNRSLEYSVINGKREIRQACEVPALTASELSVSLPLNQHWARIRAKFSIPASRKYRRCSGSQKILYGKKGEIYPKTSLT